jgi:hypothetical protein
MDDDGNQKHENQLQKQKDALTKAKSVVQRPPAQISSQPQPVANSKAPTFITYPEFAPSQQGSDGTIVSLRRLLLVLYLSAGTAATVYLVSKVLIFPRASLT